MVSPQADAESHTTLDDADFAWLQVDHSHLRLNVQDAELRGNQEITIRIAECPFLHVFVEHVNVQCKAFPEIRVSAASQGMQTIDEIGWVIVFGKWEGAPFGLFWKRIDLGIARQEAVLDVRLGLDGDIAICVEESASAFSEAWRMLQSYCVPQQVGLGICKRCSWHA